MSGIDLKIKRLFKEKQNLIISALDHVMAYGDQPGIENAREAIKNCLTTDALLLPRVMLEKNWDFFTGKNSLVPVVRLNWTSSFYYPRDYRSGHTVIVTTVEEAVKAGGEIVICSLFIENENEEMESRNIKLFSEVVRQKERLGIPLIGECYVVEHKELKEDEVHLKVKRVSRIMAELGADLIKTFYTGERFREVVDNTPVPIFTIGAEKLDTDLAVLQKAYDSVERGARGIIFGRNIFMSKNPEILIKALNEVVNQKAKPEEVLEKYKLD